MIFKFLSVAKIEAGIYQSSWSNIPTNQLNPDSTLIPPSVQSIPSSLLSPVSTFSISNIPQTIPEYLLTFPKNVQFGPLPQSIPSHLLTITSPESSSQSLVSSVQSMPSPMVVIQPIGSILTPAQAVRTKVGQTNGASNSAIFDVSSQSLPQPNGPSEPQGSVSSQETTGFLTPFKPLNFAPNLPEVNKPLPQTQQSNTGSDQSLPAPEIPAPIEQTMNKQKPLIDTEHKSIDSQRVGSSEAMQSGAGISQSAPQTSNPSLFAGFGQT